MAKKNANTANVGLCLKSFENLLASVPSTDGEKINYAELEQIKGRAKMALDHLNTILTTTGDEDTKLPCIEGELHLSPVPEVRRPCLEGEIHL